jgi:hypothetical protein
MSDLSIVDPLMKSFLEKLDNTKEYTLLELTKIAYDLSNKKGRNKKVKDPNAPPKPKSEYQLFVAEQSPIIKAENKDLKQTEIMKKVAELWKKQKETNSATTSASDSEEEQKSSSSLAVEAKPVESETKPEKKSRARKTKETKE